MQLISIDDIRRVAVLGAGTMGHGIAQVSALAGFDVALSDVAPTIVLAGIAKIREHLDGGVRRGKITADAAAAAFARVASAPSLTSAVEGADVVIEAAPERLDLKQEIFGAVDRAAHERALLATNTSSLSVAAIARATCRPSHVVGMHFFNPAHIMKLVEIVRHDDAADETVALARAFAERLGKEPIVARDVPGFASSRLGVALGLEAIRMLEAGVASAADIDRAMHLGYGHPMGPLELTDHVGLDVRLAVARYLEAELGPSFRPPRLLIDKVEAGKLGKKTGEGFYRWREGRREE